MKKNLERTIKPHHVVFFHKPLPGRSISRYFRMRLMKSSESDVFESQNAKAKALSMRHAIYLRERGDLENGGRSPAYVTKIATVASSAEVYGSATA